MQGVFASRRPKPKIHRDLGCCSCFATPREDEVPHPLLQHLPTPVNTLLMTLVVLKGSNVQSTPDNSNLQGKLKNVRVIESSSYWELRTNDRIKGKKTGVYCVIHKVYVVIKFNIGDVE